MNVLVITIILAVFVGFIWLFVMEIMSQTGRLKLKCHKCGTHTSPREDKRWYTEISGSGPETCDEYWVHDCESK